MEQRTNIQTPVTGSAQVNISEGERIASITAGSFLFVSGLLTLSQNKTNILKSLMGGYLMFRGAGGYCVLNNLLGINTASAAAEPEPLTITEVVSVNKPRSEVYNYWRKLENLPKFMTHLSEVKELDNKRSTWKAKIPGMITTVTWEAEIKQEQQNELISWSSLPGASVDNAGEVVFKDAFDGKGTEINVTISYRPPAGAIGSAVAGLFNKPLEKLVKKDIKDFKRVIETGELPKSKSNGVKSQQYA